MKIALYENGELINTIVADADFADAYCDECGYTWEEIHDEPEPAPEQLPETEIPPEELADYTATYAAMVAAGEISITDVPEQYRAGVQYTVIQTLSQGG